MAEHSSTRQASNGLRAIRRSPASHLADSFCSRLRAGHRGPATKCPFQTMVGRPGRPRLRGRRRGSRAVTGGLPAALRRGPRQRTASASLWLGPHEFLVVAPEEAHDSLGGDLIGALTAALGDGAGPGGGPVRQPHHVRALRPAGPGGAGEGLRPGPAPARASSRHGPDHGDRATSRSSCGRPRTRASGSSRGPRSRTSWAAGSWTPCGSTPPPRSPDGAQRPGPVLRWHRAVVVTHGRPDAGGEAVRRRAQGRRTAELHHAGPGRAVRLARRHRPGPRLGQGRGAGPAGPGPGDRGHRHRR